MRHSVKTYFCVFTAVLLSAWTPSAFAIGKSAPSASASIPPAPKYYVLDETSLLTPVQSQALSAMLIEHDELAGERIYVGVFKNPKQANLETLTTQIFEKWQGGRRENGILLALFTDEQEAAIRFGIRFDGRLTASKARHAEPTTRALGLNVLELLRSIDSPLIESGRAEELLRTGGLQGSLSGTRSEAASGGWWIWLFLGAIPLLMVFQNILAAEAHFTSSGWFRANPLKIVSLRNLRAKIRARHTPPTSSVGGADGSW